MHFPRWLRALLLLYVPVCAAAGFWYFSPSQTDKRALRGAVEAFNAATESKNIAATRAFFEAGLAPSATVELAVEQTVLGMKTDAVLMRQTMSTPEFIRFVELTLDPLERTQLLTRIEAIHTRADGGYTLRTASAGFAEGAHYTRGLAIPTRYSADIRCEADATITDGHVRWEALRCRIGLGAAPAGGTAVDRRALFERATGVAP